MRKGYVDSECAKAHVLIETFASGRSARFTFAITAARRSEQRRILAFIRTVDYMKCETMRVMLVRHTPSRPPAHLPLKPLHSDWMAFSDEKVANRNGVPSGGRSHEAVSPARSFPSPRV